MGIFVSMSTAVLVFLLGATEGEEVTVQLPAGDRQYRVLELTTLPQQMEAAGD